MHALKALGACAGYLFAVGYVFHLTGDSWKGDTFLWWQIPLLGSVVLTGFAVFIWACAQLNKIKP